MTFTGGDVNQTKHFAGLAYVVGVLCYGLSAGFKLIKISWQQ